MAQKMDLMVEMDPEIAEIFKKSTAVPSKYIYLDHLHIKPHQFEKYAELVNNLDKIIIIFLFNINYKIICARLI